MSDATTSFKMHPRLDLVEMGVSLFRDVTRSGRSSLPTDPDGLARAWGISGDLAANVLIQALPAGSKASSRVLAWAQRTASRSALHLEGN